MRDSTMFSRIQTRYFRSLKSVDQRLRPVQALVGPNASGKSTLLLALSYMRAVVVESATVIQPGQTYNVQPFKLDKEFAKKATEFELTFLLGGIRHQYAFTMTPRHISAPIAHPVDCKRPSPP